MAKRESDEARAAARNYLYSIKVTEASYPHTWRMNDRRGVTTWDEVLNDTARAIRELGLVGRYVNMNVPTTRQGRKQAVYRRLERRRRASPPDSVDKTAGQEG